MSNVYKLFRLIGRFKYIIVLVLGSFLVGFAGENSVAAHLRNMRRVDDLNYEIKSNIDSYRRFSEELRLLESDPKAVERIARERYFMKADDEDVFVFSDELSVDGEE